MSRKTFKWGYLKKSPDTSGAHVKKQPLFWRNWQKTSLRDLQIIVFGKVHEKVPSHGFAFTQVRVNHHALDVADCLGNTPW